MGTSNAAAQSRKVKCSKKKIRLRRRKSSPRIRLNKGKGGRAKKSSHFLRGGGQKIKKLLSTLRVNANLRSPTLQTIVTRRFRNYRKSFGIQCSSTFVKELSASEKFRLRRLKSSLRIRLNREEGVEREKK